MSTKTIHLPFAFETSGSANYWILLSFAFACSFPMVCVWATTHAFITLAFKSSTYSHIPLIPLVSIVLIYTEREQIFSHGLWKWSWGTLLVVPGIIGLWLSQSDLSGFISTNRFTFLVSGLVLIWIAVFAAFFGRIAFRNARFLLVFLLLAVPIPEPALSNLIWLLQAGSANAAAAIYRAIGVPFVRDGFVFALPGVTIRVAEECSGIRSALALFITTVLATHLWIRSKVSKLVLWTLVFPVAVIKNGMRIVTLSCLAAYVNPSFLYGRLHRYGGIPFFVLDLLMMGVAFFFATRRESVPKETFVADS